jgi:undecaprenyl diphosphate synthase
MSREPAPASEGAGAQGLPGPQHVAIIMDGNGRWAKARGLPRAAGHERGVEALRRTVEAAPELGIRYLTVFSFSTENWRRPAAEVSALVRPAESLCAARPRPVEAGRRPDPRPRTPARSAGRISRRSSTRLSARRPRIRISISTSPSTMVAGRRFIRAARRLAAAIENGELEADEIDESTFRPVSGHGRDSGSRPC